MILLSANNANTTLASSLTSGATTVLLATGDGALFPSPGLNEYFTLTLNDELTGAVYEVCWCTARSGDSCTVLRGQEGTSARSWLLGDYAYNTETAGSISAARAFSATNNPTLPYTVPPEQNGIPQYCGTTGTITLPATSGIVDGYLCPIVCTSATATITVNTNSATIVLPSGSVSSTFTITGLQSTVMAQWNAAASVWYGIIVTPRTWQTVATYTAAGATTLAIPLPVNFRRFRLTIEFGVVSAAGNNISLQFSSDGGSTYLTSANYTYIQDVTDSNALNTPAGTLTATAIPLSVLMGASTTAAPWDGTFNIQPGAAGSAPRVYGNALGVESTGQAIGGFFSGSWGGSPAVMNYMRLLTAAGTFSCTAILEALP